MAEYINGNITREEMIERVKTETRRYAKRQLTWFRKYKHMVWLDGENTVEDNVQAIIDNVHSTFQH